MFARPRFHDQQPSKPLFCTHLEVIQLVEVPPPSRSHYISVPSSSSAPSSSESSSSEEESVSSYCSSDLSSEDQPPPLPRAREPEVVSSEQSWHARMRRIEAWRDNYAKAVGAEFAPSPSRTKRKGPEDQDDDTFSRSSKRSRQTSSFTEHSCSACNASFATRQSLRRHGRGVRTNEACRAAVEYGFE
ncbi:hypothetical protein BD410DRAFT_151949 [Rickenella mellea]|uniref:C2H2-type domain-containing protein n=1 Tax=Rickenella mellea TaxID=50990 RepID=A0A4Y7QAD0_9AGAM|nr:hypothetical protein BD410DRAFT_151949 [Rickenella mellea]